MCGAMFAGCLSLAAIAQARSGYIANAEEGLGITEYDYVAGTVLVRVSSALTSDEAKMYQAALA